MGSYHHPWLPPLTHPSPRSHRRTTRPPLPFLPPATSAAAACPFTALLGPTLLPCPPPSPSQSGSLPLPTSTALPSPSRVLLVFSARWSPPCRSYAAHLSRHHPLALRRDGAHVVLVSLDADARSFDQMGGAGPWLAVPFEDKGRRRELAKRFAVRELREWSPQVVAPRGPSGGGRGGGRAPPRAPCERSEERSVSPPNSEPRSAQRRSWCSVRRRLSRWRTGGGTRAGACARRA